MDARVNIPVVEKKQKQFGGRLQLERQHLDMIQIRAACVPGTLLDARADFKC